MRKRRRESGAADKEARGLVRHMEKGRVPVRGAVCVRVYRRGLRFSPADRPRGEMDRQQRSLGMIFRSRSRRTGEAGWFRALGVYPLVAVLLAAGSAGGQDARGQQPGAPMKGDGVTWDAMSGEGGSSLIGLIRPAQQATIAAPSDGVLMDIRVEEGQRVEAGEVLAIMDNRVMRASVELVRIRAARTGKVREADAALALAETLLERLTRASHESATTRFEVEETEIERDRAQARLEMAREELAIASAELELERQKLERLTMRAPFAGRVVRLTAREGEMLESATPVLRLVALQRLEAEIHVPFESCEALVVGRRYRLEAEAPAQEPIEGTLRYVSPVIDSSSRTLRCVFVIPNGDERLPAGLVVRMPTPLEEMRTADATEPGG